MQTAANYHIYMEMEGARMIQKEKIRGVGYFLMALAAGLLPFAAPDDCAQALREGLALCGGPLLLSLFPFLIVSTLLIQCPAADVLGLPFCPAARLIGVRAPAAGRVLLIGSLGGFAPAASAAAGAVRSGQLTARETFSSLCGRVTTMRRLPSDCALLVFLGCCFVVCELSRVLAKELNQTQRDKVANQS